MNERSVWERKRKTSSERITKETFSSQANATPSLGRTATVSNAQETMMRLHTSKSIYVQGQELFLVPRSSFLVSLHSQALSPPSSTCSRFSSDFNVTLIPFKSCA